MAALFIRGFVVQAFMIPSGSMEETLKIGDHILVNKFIYGVKIPFTGTNLIKIKEPKKGDIVVFKYPKDKEKDFIKRVIAVAGDEVKIEDKKVYVNGRYIEEPYTVYSDSFVLPKTFGPRDNFGPVKVPDNCLFVLGDNRDNSLDSRFWGFVNKKYLKGTAFMIYLSFEKSIFNPRWSRFFSILI